jgi:hypothetical protein
MNTTNADTTQNSPELLMRLVIPGRLPSWNALLAMGHWQRHKLKRETQESFLCALRAADDASLTSTTSVKSMWLIAADTLESYRATALAKRKLRLNKKRSAAKSRKKL